MRALATAVLVLMVGCTSASGPIETTPGQASPAATQTTATPTPATSSPAASPVAGVGPISESRSDLPRNPIDAASQADLEQVVAGDQAFAFDLYRTLLSEEEGNLFLSPYSISTALSMVLAGARGPTAEELASALHAAAGDEAWHVARNRLELGLIALADYQMPGSPDSVPLTLEPTNAIFGRVGYPFKQEYLDILAANYGAGMSSLDMAGDPEGSRTAINDWVAERTRDRIEELLAPGFIEPDTVAVLVNAIFFKANWLYDFNPQGTTDEQFHTLSGSDVPVRMMHRNEKWQYVSGEGWQAVELPYVGGASMLVIVPDEERFAEIEATVDEDFVAELAAGLSEHLVDLSLPRWESESELDLIPHLRALGIDRLFGAADLSGIADAGLSVSDVVHAANVTVDELGTEAAAATAVGIRESGAPPVRLSVDRPFIYLIRDDQNGEILFMGRLLDPS